MFAISSEHHQILCKKGSQRELFYQTILRLEGKADFELLPSLISENLSFYVDKHLFFIFYLLLNFCFLNDFKTFRLISTIALQIGIW